MITIRPITPAQTYPLRHAVLWPDKPLDYVKIDIDDEGFHFGAFSQDELVAVISLFVYEGPADGKVVRFRKFATHPDHQRQGIGTQLMHYIIHETRRQNAATLWCDARLDASDFYRRFGMEAVSEVFYKGLVPYAKFSLTLT